MKNIMIIDRYKLFIINHNFLLKLSKIFLFIIGLITFSWLNLVFLKTADLERYSTRNDNLYVVVERVPGEIQKLANCIIIGARKCGTRALLEFLNLHPDIRTARQETHYFDQDQTYNKGVEWYRTQMPYASFDNTIIIEKTPGYFVSAKAVERVHKYNSSIKLILILRNPVTRLVSDYTQVHFTKLSKGKSHESFEKVVFDEHGDVRACYKPVRNSLYVKHVSRWLEKFQLENLHIVDGDRFIRDPLYELRRLETYLGLAHKITHQHIYFNESKGFYCYRHPKEGAKCLGETKGRRHINVSGTVIDKLRTFFQPYNDKLFSLVNRTFDW